MDFNLDETVLKHNGYIIKNEKLLLGVKSFKAKLLKLFYNSRDR